MFTPEEFRSPDLSWTRMPALLRDAGMAPIVFHKSAVVYAYSTGECFATGLL
jgi:hypothetical protein